MRGEDTQGDAGREHRSALPDEQPRQACGVGAERHSDGNLPFPLANGIGHDAVDADQRQRAGDGRKRRQQRREEPRARDQLVDDGLERAGVGDGDFRIDRAEGGTERRHQGGGIPAVRVSTNVNLPGTCAIGTYASASSSSAGPWWTSPTIPITVR